MSKGWYDRFALPCGERHPKAKLTNEQVRSIRADRECWDEIYRPGQEVRRF